MKVFRIVSVLEGLSYLVILSVSFQLIGREYVFPLGMGHGILFMAYMVLSLQVSHKAGWPIFTWLLVFLASVVPLAFVLVEVFLRKSRARNITESVAPEA